MSGDYEAILPDWWIEKHKPKYTHGHGVYQASFPSEFANTAATSVPRTHTPGSPLDESLLTDPEAGIPGTVCAAPTEKDAIARVPYVCHLEPLTLGIT